MFRFASWPTSPGLARSGSQPSLGLQQSYGKAELASPPLMEHSYGASEAGIVSGVDEGDEAAACDGVFHVADAPLYETGDFDQYDAALAPGAAL